MCFTDFSEEKKSSWFFQTLRLMPGWGGKCRISVMEFMILHEQLKFLRLMPGWGAKLLCRISVMEFMILHEQLKFHCQEDKSQATLLVLAVGQATQGARASAAAGVPLILFAGSINSLASGGCGCNVELVILKLISRKDNFWSVFCEIALRWMLQYLTSDWSTWVGTITDQATSHYLSQCQPRCVLPYGVTISQWVNHVSSLAMMRLDDGRTEAATVAGVECHQLSNSDDKSLESWKGAGLLWCHSLDCNPM